MCTAYIYLPTYSYLPTYLTTYLPTYLPTDLFKDLPTYLLISTYIPNYIPTYISTYIPTYRPIYRPTYQPMFLWVCLCVNISHCELIFSGTNLKMFFFYFLQSSLSLSLLSLSIEYETIFVPFLLRVLTENYYDGSLMEWTIHLFHLSDSKKSQIKLIRHDRREQARRINRQRRETKTFQSKKESRGNKDQSSSKSIAATVSGTSN